MNLLSGLRMHDVEVQGADLATRVEVYDGRGGELAAACQLAFTIVTPGPR